MQLAINQKTISLLKAEGFHPDTMMTAYLTLIALFQKRIDVLNMLDDDSTSRRMTILYYDMVRKGLLTPTPEGGNMFELTEAGMAFINKLSGSPQKRADLDIETWFPLWFNLWPKGVKTMGKLVRSDEKGCLKKMRHFVKEYPQYSPETIVSATSLYLGERAEEEYKGVRCATYFIHHKDSGSDLASWCEQANDLSAAEPEVQTPNNFFI